MSVPSSFRFHKLWLALGWLLVLAVVYLSLTPHPPEIPVEQGDKLSHVMAYAAQMLWFAQIYPARRARTAWALAFVALGVGLEFAQLFTDYRTFDVADMTADALGVAAGWIAAPPRLPNVLQWLDFRLRPRAGG